MGFECSETSVVAEIFPVLTINLQHRRQLSLILIDMNSWLKTKVSVDWPACIQYVREARENGLKIIVLWEDFWVNNQEIVQSRLVAVLGLAHKIPARLTKVRRIDKETANHFLSENHLNNVVSAKYKYGLFLPSSYFRVLSTALMPDPTSAELLVAVATFSFPRIFNKETNPLRSHELIRFASLRGTNVVGGLDKLLQAFIRDKEPGDIMTYADVEWSAGDSYAKLGFKTIAQTQPEAIYLDPETRLRKSRAELAAASSHNYVQIMNMGSIKFVKPVSIPGQTDSEHVQ